MILTKEIPYKGKLLTYEQLKPGSKIKISVSCPKCDVVFQSTKWQLARNGHELCQSCAIASKLSKDIPAGSTFNRLTVVGAGSKSGFSVCRCTCGTVKEVRNNSLKNRSTQSCGCLRSDKGKYQAMTYFSVQKRSAHPNWKGGVSPIRNCIEKTTAYKTWREAVLSSHTSFCQKCGSSEGVLAHHICNFRDYPELRFTVSNGACLCDKCHRDFHARFGLKSTTQEQFAEFMIV